MNLTQQNIPRSKHKRANVNTLLVTYLTDKGLSDRAHRKCKLRVSAASSQSPKPEHLTAWRGCEKANGRTHAQRRGEVCLLLQQTPHAGTL